MTAKIRFSRGLGASFEANRTRAICKVAPATSVRCYRWRPAAMTIPLQPPGPTSVSARSRLAKRCFASGCARPARTLALRARLAALARTRPLLRSCGSLEFLPRRLPCLAGLRPSRHGRSPKSHMCLNLDTHLISPALHVRLGPRRVCHGRGKKFK